MARTALNFIIHGHARSTRVHDPKVWRARRVGKTIRVWRACRVDETLRVWRARRVGETLP